MHPQGFLDEGRNSIRLLAQHLLILRPVTQGLYRGTEELRDRLLPRREQKRGRFGDFDQLRCRAIGIDRSGHPGKDIVLRFAASFREVTHEPVVQVLQRVQTHRLPVEGTDAVAIRTLSSQRRQELGTVGLGNAQQVDDGRGGEWFCVLAQEFATAAFDELVDLTIDQPPCTPRSP